MADDANTFADRIAGDMDSGVVIIPGPGAATAQAELLQKALDPVTDAEVEQAELSRAREADEDAARGA